MAKELEKCDECGTPMYLAHGMILTCQDEDCPSNEMSKPCPVCDLIEGCHVSGCSNDPDACDEEPPDQETILTDCYWCGVTFDTGCHSVEDVGRKPDCGACAGNPYDGMVSHAGMVTGN